MKAIITKVDSQLRFCQGLDLDIRKITRQKTGETIPFQCTNEDGLETYSLVKKVDTTTISPEEEIFVHLNGHNLNTRQFKTHKGGITIKDDLVIVSVICEEVENFTFSFVKNENGLNQYTIEDSKGPLHGEFISLTFYRKEK